MVPLRTYPFKGAVPSSTPKYHPGIEILWFGKKNILQQKIRQWYFPAVPKGRSFLGTSPIQVLNFRHLGDFRDQGGGEAVSLPGAQRTRQLTPPGLYICCMNTYVYTYVICFIIRKGLILYQHRPQIAQTNLCAINVEKGAPNVNSAKVGS